jgi:NAD-dependent SIR2 family protein deacetylase
MTDYKKIFDWLTSAKSMVITAGAGIGVDSGLADYRGTGGQWGNVETEVDKSVFDVVNPKSFVENPKFGWKMYSTRLIEYSNTEPHAGFKILQNWIQRFNLDYFVLTSNVDNQFQKAGFKENNIRELHGSIFHLQCSIPCSNQIWKHDFNLNTILTDIEKEKFPKCLNCGNILRPNVYMFRDNTYLSQRSNEQEARFQEFLKTNENNPMIVFEIGSGPHVQSIRKKTRMLGIDFNAKIVRINPKDAKIKEPHIGIAKGALETLLEIDEFINKYDLTNNK